MDRGSGMRVTDRFAAYISELTKVVGHADRAGPLRDYCSGLLATEGRRSVEPMAAVTAPSGFGTASEAAAFRCECGMVGRADAGQGARLGDAVDDAAGTDRSLDHRRYIVSQERPAFGRGASSVLRTYLGKQANCQVAVTLSIANHQGSLRSLIGCTCRRHWTGDRSRRAKAPCAVLDQVQDQTAARLEQIRAAVGGERGSRCRTDGRGLW